MGFIEELQNKQYNKAFYDAEEKTALQKLADEPDRLQQNHKYLAIIYGFMCRHDECLLHATKAIALASSAFEKADARILIARSYISQNEINHAIAEYLLAYDDDPTHEVVAEELGHCYKHLLDYDNALHWYKVMGSIEDCYADAYNIIGIMYFEKREFDTALLNYMKVLATEPDNMDALYGAGISNAEAGRNEKAMEYFNQMLKLEPQNADAMYGLGLVYQRQEDYYRALHHYTEALKISSEFPEIYNNIAKIHLELDGDVKAALADLEKAASLATDSQQRMLFYLNLSRLYNSIKDEEKHQYWKKKLLDEIGFGGLFNFEDDDDDEDEDGDILK